MINIFKKIKEKLNKFSLKIKELEQLGLYGLYDLSNELADPNSKLHCQKCGRYLRILRLMNNARYVNMGKKYKVVCPKCKHINIIIKGSD